MMRAIKDDNLVDRKPSKGGKSSSRELSSNLVEVPPMTTELVVVSWAGLIISKVEPLLCVWRCGFCIAGSVGGLAVVFRCLKLMRWNES